MEFYDLEELLNLLDQCENKSFMEQQRLFDEYRKNFPDQPIPIPEYEFSLPKALRTIVKEIMEIKNDKRIHDPKIRHKKKK